MIFALAYNFRAVNKHNFGSLEFLHNLVLYVLDLEWQYRLAFAGTATATAVALVSLRFPRRADLVWWPTWFLTLGPATLVEPRYVLPLAALFQLWRPRRALGAELALLAWFAAASLWVYRGMMDYRFLL
jgi:hypothetical protein